MGGRWARAPRNLRIAAPLLGLAILTASFAVYYYLAFLGMENPFTHVFPVSFDYFAYVQTYQQVQADFSLTAWASVTFLALAALSLALTRLKEVPAFSPLREAASFLQAAPRSLKTAAFLVPLLLLEAGLGAYGGLMGVEILNMPLSVSLRDNPLVRVLYEGPLSSAGGSYGTWQDYYFLALYVLVLLATRYRFGSVRRVIQVGALAIIPLPAMVYLFDRIEFNTFFASVAVRVGLGWLSNALLLYSACAVLLGATAYPAIDRAVGKRIRSAHQHSEVRRDGDEV